ncbi:SDR family NAD(P)-dependent oxidoreductase [Qipengyuania sp. GH25]|uniref:SDR family NAD(P)-dependent oxidoreductase n=1 Tax=Qipengyuania pacifica TaxID=2860199 RepID=A0ABS7JK61_9SPHN|nr:SDR family NAD(P)-dependent oxidoreductase [Qipengyuania aerophila]MBX7489784.1 SDR family NAD(P)-dependent oxidoreductase [Qipengyuania aerophila]
MKSTRRFHMANSFGFKTTADEVLEGIDLSGRTMLVTGGNGGVGQAIVHALAKAGADVIMTARKLSSAEAAAEPLRKSAIGQIECRSLDLADPSSIRSLLADWERPLDALINNAGVMALPSLQRTGEGHEMQFATNFLGHFALTRGLHEFLRERRGRVVSVASTGSLFGPILWDDPAFRFIRYDPLLAYAQSKTACILFSVALSRKWGADGITSNSLHPGAIATGLQQHTGGLQTPEKWRKTPEQGAATSVLLAASPLVEGVSGRYFEDCQEAPIIYGRPEERVAGLAPYAIDPSNAERLWQMASAMTDYSA